MGCSSLRCLLCFEAQAFLACPQLVYMWRLPSLVLLPSVGQVFVVMKTLNTQATLYTKILRVLKLSQLTHCTRRANILAN